MENDQIVRAISESIYFLKMSKLISNDDRNDKKIIKNCIEKAQISLKKALKILYDIGVDDCGKYDYLLEHQPDIIDAAIYDDSNGVSFFLEQGNDVNFTEDSERITPLHYAAKNNSIKVIPILIAAGANSDALDGNNSKPIDDAKRLKNHIAVELLTTFSEIE